MQENYLTHNCKTWFKYKRRCSVSFVCWGILYKGCKEQFYHVEIFYVADACHGRSTLFRDPCRTNTQIPDLWGGITLLTVCWMFDMPMEQMQLILNKGSRWGMLNSYRKKNRQPFHIKEECNCNLLNTFCFLKSWTKRSKLILLLKAAKVCGRTRNTQHISNVSVTVQSFQGHCIWPK